MIYETNPSSGAVKAGEIIKGWRIDYNSKRPHSSLNGLTPTEFAARPAKEGQNEGQFGEQAKVIELKPLATRSMLPRSSMRTYFSP